MVEETAHCGSRMSGRDTDNTAPRRSLRHHAARGAALPGGGGRRATHVNTCTHPGAAAGHHTPRGASSAQLPRLGSAAQCLGAPLQGVTSPPPPPPPPGCSTARRGGLRRDTKSRGVQHTAQRLSAAQQHTRNTWAASYERLLGHRHTRNTFPAVVPGEVGGGVGGVAAENAADASNSLAHTELTGGPGGPGRVAVAGRGGAGGGARRGRPSLTLPTAASSLTGRSSGPGGAGRSEAGRGGARGR